MLSFDEESLCNKAGIAVLSRKILAHSGLTVPSQQHPEHRLPRGTIHVQCLLVTSGVYLRVYFLSKKMIPLLIYYCLLIPASQQVCTDTVTNAKLDRHLISCVPPSLPIYFSPELQAIVPATKVMEKYVFMDMLEKLGLVFVSRLPNTAETTY